MKTFVMVAMAAALVGAGTVSPASAGSKPAQVGRIIITEGADTSLRLDWPSASGARKYVVERATNLDMTDRKEVARVEGTAYTVTGLKPGTFYCFQVRAKNGPTFADRSRKTCQFTSTDLRNASGPKYRMVTYNICQTACPNWSGRKPNAASLLRSANADVIGLQEAGRDNGLASAVGGFTQVHAMSGKALLYKTTRFSVAKNPDGSKRTGHLVLGYDERKRKHRYAVWAELLDKQHNDRRVIFVTTHLSPGEDNAHNDDYRRRQTVNLVDGLKRINPQDRPLVLGGDFNSSYSRDHDSPGRLLRNAGLGHAYNLADRWTNPLHNSANKGLAEPSVGVPWGHHIDQVWVDPRRFDVLGWANAAKLSNGVYSPLPSNHNPILAEVQLH